LGHAHRSAELSKTVDAIVLNQRAAGISGLLRLSAPPNISDTLLAPLMNAFQSEYPNVRVRILVTDPFVDHIAEGVDVVFRLGLLKDSSLAARTILTYRHRLVASPSYLAHSNSPRNPRDLVQHPLLAFASRQPENHWHFVHVNGFPILRNRKNFFGILPNEHATRSRSARPGGLSGTAGWSMVRWRGTGARPGPPSGGGAVGSRRQHPASRHGRGPQGPGAGTRCGD
jgi:DNA-binding transcriptional LysR family regulator